MEKFIVLLLLCFSIDCIAISAGNNCEPSVSNGSDPDNQIDSSLPTGPSKQTEPNKPVEPRNSEEPGKLTDPVNPTGPGNPTGKCTMSDCQSITTQPTTPNSPGGDPTTQTQPSTSDCFDEDKPCESDQYKTILPVKLGSQGEIFDADLREKNDGAIQFKGTSIVGYGNIELGGKSPLKFQPHFFQKAPPGYKCQP